MLTESDSRELIHDGYVMYIHHQDCQHCDCSEEYSQLYEVWIHPSKTRISGFRDLRPLAGPIKDNLSIIAIVLPPRQIPYCSECVMTYEPKGGTIIPLASRDEWTATLKRKYTPTAAPAKPARQPPTLDQI